MIFEQKIAKSLWCFCQQRQKQGLLGNLVRAETSLFVPFATFCKKGLGELI
jgi:hypothetical protein